MKAELFRLKTLKCERTHNNSIRNREENEWENKIALLVVLTYFLPIRIMHTRTYTSTAIRQCEWNNHTQKKEQATTIHKKPESKSAIFFVLFANLSVYAHCSYWLFSHSPQSIFILLFRYFLNRFRPANSIQLNFRSMNW